MFSSPVLLWGPPGTGKSTAFDCAAGEIIRLHTEMKGGFTLPEFFEVTEADFKNAYIGETEKNVKVR